MIELVDPDESSKFVQDEGEKTSQILISRLYKNYEEDESSILCEIHDIFSADNDNSHNCIGCNLNESIAYLVKSLSTTFPTAYHSYEIFNSFTIGAYLFIERVEHISGIIQIPENYWKSKFYPFIDIRRWTNFIKHPKAFIFVHHPEYYFEDQVEYDKLKEDKQLTVIDQEFISTYYAGSQNNRKLHKILTNKENVVVIYPSLQELATKFCDSVDTFKNLIANNQVFQEILNDKSTIEDYYDDQDLQASLPVEL